MPAARTCATKATSGWSRVRPSTSPGLRSALDEAGISVDSADVEMVPNTSVEVSDESTAKRVLKLIELFEEHDDVQTVWANFDIPDEILERVERLSRSRDDPPGRRPAGLRSNECLSSASTPACRGAATAACASEGGRTDAPSPPASSRRPVDEPVPRRLATLRAELNELVGELHPDVVVVERVFFQTNARTAMSVGQASGVAMLTAVELGCRGRRVHLERGQARRDRLRRRDQGPGAAHGGAPAAVSLRSRSPPDAADALALALCHLVHRAVGTARPPPAGRPSTGAGTAP